MGSLSRRFSFQYWSKCVLQIFATNMLKSLNSLTIYITGNRCQNHFFRQLPIVHSSPCAHYAILCGVTDCSPISIFYFQMVCFASCRLCFATMSLHLIIVVFNLIFVFFESHFDLLTFFRVNDAFSAFIILKLISFDSVLPNSFKTYR